MTCGDDDSRAFARRPPAKLAVARALFVSEREALTLTEESDVEAAAQVLGKSAERVIVTLGADGAMSLVGGPQHARAGHRRRRRSTRRAPAICWWRPTSGPTCGACRPRSACTWAVLYAGLSIATPTGVGGAVSEARLLEEGAQRGLTAPRSATA